MKSLLQNHHTREGIGRGHGHERYAGSNALYDGNRRPISKKQMQHANACMPSPAHVLQIQLQLATVDAKQGYLLIWTMRNGCALYSVRRDERLISALAALATEVADLLRHHRHTQKPVLPGFTMGLRGALAHLAACPVCLYLINTNERRLCMLSASLGPGGLYGP